MENTTNLLKLSLYNLSNIKLITININQGNEYGNKWKHTKVVWEQMEMNMDSKAVWE